LCGAIRWPVVNERFRVRRALAVGGADGLVREIGAQADGRRVWFAVTRLPYARFSVVDESVRVP